MKQQREEKRWQTEKLKRQEEHFDLQREENRLREECNSRGRLFAALLEKVSTSSTSRALAATIVDRHIPSSHPLIQPQSHGRIY